MTIIVQKVKSHKLSIVYGNICVQYNVLYTNVWNKFFI